MSEAPRTALRCPNCGAPLPPEALHEAASCAFCGIASAPDPPHASSVPRSTELLSASELDCPRCGLHLFEGSARGISLHGCGRCGGIWIDNAAAQRALATLDTVVVELSDRAGDRAATSVDRSPSVTCPACSRVLSRMTLTRNSIVIDMCGDHGTWFDRYELSQVLAGLRSAPAPAPAPARLRYDGPVPDFHAGANPDAGELLAFAAGGAFTLLAALASTGSKS